MHINILGTRGIPAAHGGFETFVANLAPWLVGRGHTVTVYCQDDDGDQLGPWVDHWNGIERVHFHPSREGPVGTMQFDLACVHHVVRRPGVDLVLGYNTAIFNLLQRVRKRRVVMNMDGIEWKRDKWSVPAKIWFFCNEVFGANVAQILIADHPEIAAHVEKRCFKKPVIIPYGSDAIYDAPTGPVTELGLEPDNYAISIARIEPENSILELVRAFAATKTSAKLVVLGKFDPSNPYHEAVKAAGNSSTVFPGAIYEPEKVAALRFHARAYLHGHTVGGTNPSLVEALGAGNAVIAHDNRFNRWVAGDAHFYFANEAEAAEHMEYVLSSAENVFDAKVAARAKHLRDFQWENILGSYESVLMAAAAA